MTTVNEFIYPEEEPDYHSQYSLTVREIVESGFDPFGDDDFSKITWPSDDNPNSYLSQTESRIKLKFLRRFWFAEIEPRVPNIWRFNVTTKMLMIVPKYTPLWKIFSKNPDPFITEDKYGKRRNVFSDFPSVQLNQNENDYASNAEDNQYEDITSGDLMEKMEQLKSYNDVDVAFLDELEPCFNQILSQTIGGM